MAKRAKKARTVARTGRPTAAKTEARKAAAAAAEVRTASAGAKAAGSAGSEKQPNILVIWGDDIGISNLSCYTHGLMGYQTPNIDRIAKEGMMFTDSYGEQSCTAGRSSFITGQSVYRTGLSKVGIPAAPIGMSEKLVTIAALLKEQGYATGQFGKNHLGDLNHMLPTNHGFLARVWRLMKSFAAPTNSSSQVSMRLVVSGPVSLIFCLPTLPQRGITVLSSLSVAHEWITPRGPNCSRYLGSFG